MRVLQQSEAVTLLCGHPAGAFPGMSHQVFQACVCLLDLTSSHSMKRLSVDRNLQSVMSVRPDQTGDGCFQSGEAARDWEHWKSPDLASGVISTETSVPYLQQHFRSEAVFSTSCNTLVFRSDET